MASLNLRLAENAPGELFVDSTCIDCDTCRELAPDIFGSLDDGQSYVLKQPGDWDAALRALVSCPTASIGASRSAAAAARTLPLEIAPGVYRCGYSSESSYGAQSYYLQRPDGNVLIDSPRFAKPLVQRLTALGGVRRMFLTHRDDVADHAKFRAEFGCERVIHRADNEIDAEISLGDEPVEIARGLLAIPVPGHTRGSCALLVDERYLFTGDHLWADDEGNLQASRSVCWHSWPRQLDSLKKLLGYRFSQILPGHGRSLRAPDLHDRLSALLKSAID